MKAGEGIREAFKLYLGNPVMLLPYFLSGLFNTFLLVFSENFVRESFSQIKITSSLQLILLRKEIADVITAVFLKNFLFFIFIVIIYFFIDSVVKAYTIGLAEKISKNSKACLRSGISTISRAATIFAKNIIIFVLMLFGCGLILLTSLILLGKFALLAFFPAVIIYAFIIFVITFFSSQSIVIEKTGPWQGIVSGYSFIKRNMEDTAKLILFIIFVYVAFYVIKIASLRLFEHFFSGIAMSIIIFSENILLWYLIMRPYFVILKTLYFVKNKKMRSK